MDDNIRCSEDSKLMITIGKLTRNSYEMQDEIEKIITKPA